MHVLCKILLQGPVRTSQPWPPASDSGSVGSLWLLAMLETSWNGVLLASPPCCLSAHLVLGAFGLARGKAATPQWVLGYLWCSLHIMQLSAKPVKGTMKNWYKHQFGNGLLNFQRSQAPAASPGPGWPVMPARDSPRPVPGCLQGHLKDKHNPGPQWGRSHSRLCLQILVYKGSLSWSTDRATAPNAPESWGWTPSLQPLRSKRCP